MVIASCYDSDDSPFGTADKETNHTICPLCSSGSLGVYAPKWRYWTELNRQPPVYKTGVLPLNYNTERIISCLCRWESNALSPALSARASWVRSRSVPLPQSLSPLWTRGDSHWRPARSLRTCIKSKSKSGWQSTVRHLVSTSALSAFVAYHP